jgi:hypothetical protein
MISDRSDHDAALSALDVLVGEWTVQTGIPDVPPGRVVFEWALDHTFLVQRSEVPRSRSRAVSRSSPGTRRRAASPSTTSTREGSSGCTG